MAVGTDGYPSALADEAAVLREEGARHGEDETTIANRLAAGDILAMELLGPDMGPDEVVREGDVVRRVTIAGRTVVENGELVSGDIEAIRAEAARQAPRLWSRMRALDS